MNFSEKYSILAAIYLFTRNTSTSCEISSNLVKTLLAFLTFLFTCSQFTSRSSISCWIRIGKCWLYCQKQPSAGVLKKNCSEYMQQIYRRTTVSKCDFNKVSKGEDSLWNVSSRAFHEMRISRFHRVKLPGNVQDILSQPFHEIWKFWKSIFRIFCTVKDFSVEFVFMLD